MKKAILTIAAISVLVLSYAQDREKDFINLTKILDERGWLGADVIGGQGNSALFLVIQHSDLTIQEKYLPMMREAYKKQLPEIEAMQKK